MKGKPYSDAEIRPESGEVTRFLKRHQYDSPEWYRDAGIKQRGLGTVEADDGFGNRVYQIDTIPTPDKEKI
jgi:hypothetical protein